MKTSPIYQERQRYTSVWLWALLIGLDLLIAWGLFQQVVLGEEFGNQPASDAGLVIILLLCLGLTYFFYSMHLDIRVYDDRLSFRYVPLQGSFRSIYWKDLDKVELKQVRPLFQFGGWGIRFGTGGERVYSVKGREVIYLYLNLQSKPKYVLGTQRGEELLAAIEKARSGTN